MGGLSRREHVSLGLSQGWVAVRPSTPFLFCASTTARSCNDVQKAPRPEIRDIVAGSQQGKTEDSRITLFDTTGLAIRDVICAWKGYEVAGQEKLGIQMDSLYS